jgi:hypothetical protein
MLPVRELIYKDKIYDDFITLFSVLKEDGISTKDKIVEFLLSLGFPKDMSEFVYMKYKNFSI